MPLPFRRTAVSYPIECSGLTSGSRFLFHGCGPGSEEPSWSPARLLRGGAVTSCHVFVRPPRPNAPRRAGPRLPDVCDRSPRALLRGVPRKGSNARLAASPQAPRLVDRARPRRSTEVRCGRSTALERGRRFAARSGRTGSGGSPSVDEGGGGDDAQPSSAPARRVVVELRADQDAQRVRQYAVLLTAGLQMTQSRCVSTRRPTRTSGETALRARSRAVPHSRRPRAAAGAFVLWGVGSEGRVPELVR